MIIGAVVAAILIGRGMRGEITVENTDTRKITDVVPVGVAGVADNIIDAVVDPVSNKPNADNAVASMVRGSELKQIVLDCKEVVNYGIKF